jgi:hypothetical protein
MLNRVCSSLKMVVAIDDVELALLVSLYVVLLQAIGECQYSFSTDDNIL